jgi:hypothetical protein
LGIADSENFQVDNFQDNMLAYFTQYRKAGKNSPLTKHGNSYLGLEQFYEDAANGTLPQISYIVGPAELSEHYPYLPSDGAWLQKKVVDAVTSSPLYKETVLIISYDGKCENEMEQSVGLICAPFQRLEVMEITLPHILLRKIHLENGFMTHTAWWEILLLAQVILSQLLTRSILNNHRLPSPIVHHLALDSWRSRFHRTRRPQLPKHVRRRMAHSPRLPKHPQ